MMDADLATDLNEYEKLSKEVDIYYKNIIVNKNNIKWIRISSRIKKSFSERCCCSKKMVQKHFNALF